MNAFNVMQNNAWKGIIRTNKAGELVNNAGTLRHEDHKRIKDTITQVREHSLFGIRDLLSAGLVSSEDFGTQQVGVENINEFTEAVQSMNEADFSNDDTDFLLDYTPLPITHKGWSIPARQVGKPYKRSQGLMASVSSVGNRLEDMLFNGSPDIVVGGQTIYGYMTHPDRNLGAISDWTNILTNGDKIIPETVALVALTFSDSIVETPNSLMLYVSTDIWEVLENDYSTLKGDRTYIERMKALSAIIDVKPSSKLAAKSVALVEMRERTISLSRASDIATIPLLRDAGILSPQRFVTFAIMVPIFSPDRNGALGVTTATAP